MTRLAGLLLALWGSVALALEPSEMLSDPSLEARARALDHAIRCVKCQSEAIASSNASWAVDARRQVRELINSGSSDDEVQAWFVTRYGEFVLMDPAKTGSNLWLWLAGPLAFLLAGVGAVFYLRGRAQPAPVTALSPDEEAKLKEILDR